MFTDQGLQPQRHRPDVIGKTRLVQEIPDPVVGHPPITDDTFADRPPERL